jgi:VWFA-related protein
LKGLAALAVIAAVVGLSLSIPHAQQTTFRAGVDVVSLDVTVLDKSRRPIRGLTAADFTVLEGGKPRPIVAFEEVVLPQAAIDPAAAPWLRDAPRDVVSNDPSEGRLVVIMFDHSVNAGTGRAWAAVLARTIANRIIDQLGPGDLAAVIFTQHLARPQNFTADKSRLRHSVESPVIGTSLIDNGAASGQCPCGLCSLEAVTQVATAMADVPRRQKVLFFIGRQIAVNVELDAGPLSCDPYRIPATAEMFLAAQRANVVVHALDPGGLLPPAAFSAGNRAVLLPALAGGANKATESLQILAERTGGRAVFNQNAPEQAVPGIFAESSGYYLIGFEVDTSRPAANPRTFHAVDVRVNGRDVSVQNRSGYYLPSAAKPGAATPVESTVSALETALLGQLPTTQIPLRVAIAPFRSAGSADPALAITLNLKSDPPLGGRIEAIATAYDTEGRAIGSQRLDVDLPESRDAAGAREHELQSRIELRPGHYEVRLAAREERSGRIGSVYTFVDVPDFRKAALSLSGVAMQTSAGPRPVASDTLQSLLPLAPTAVRTFATTSAVRAFARVYQPETSKPKAVTVRGYIVDASNRRVFDRSMALTAAQFVKGAADCLLTLPLAQLSPGAHLLTIEASVGKTTVTRQVRFVVTR